MGLDMVIPGDEPLVTDERELFNIKKMKSKHVSITEHYILAILSSFIVMCMDFITRGFLWKPVPISLGIHWYSVCNLNNSL